MHVQSASLQAIKVDVGYIRAKRVLDVVFTLLILVPLGIIIVVVALLIFLNSPGPIFFRQKRVGLNGDEFVMLKFRSMHEGSDDSIHRKAVEQYMNGGVINGNTNGTTMPYKLSNDPRITKVGRLIRKTSLDELPQFINVLRGEMSLVGPRPPLPYEAARYTPHEWLRLSGKPGLTGPWQIYARSRASFHEMVEMDIAYLQQQSFWQDLKLIALTPTVMILGRGGA